MALGERMAKGTRPPHLRAGNARQRCATCRFMGRGECLKYGYPVRPTQLCDSFAAADSSKKETMR